MAVSEDFHVKWADRADRQWMITLTFNILGDKVGCTGFKVASESGDQAVSASLLREIPISRLVDQVLMEPSPKLMALAGLPTINELQALASRGLGLMREGSPGKPNSGQGRPPVYGPDHYATVAQIYQVTPRRPTEAVAAHFGVPRSRAANWVRKARTLGLINKPSPKAGRRGTASDEH
jgi:hypothetical protein